VSMVQLWSREPTHRLGPCEQIGASGFTPEMAAEFEELREAQDAERETAGTTESTAEAATDAVPPAGSETVTEPVSIKRDYEGAGVDHSVRGSDSEYEDDVFIDESKLAEFLRKGPIHLEDREGMVDSSDEDTTSEVSKEDGSESEDGGVEVQSEEEIVEVRRTWQDDAETEAAKFGRVPDGVRLACTGRGSRRKGGSKGSRIIRDTVKASLIDKQKKELRTRPGNDQKGRERRKLKETLKEL
jgi:hypothetical protein